MSRRGWLQALWVAIVALCVLILPAASSGQGRSQQAFERIREIQERYTERLMARAGVVGTAVGVDQSGSRAVLVFLEQADNPGLPKQLDGAPVEPVVTGKIYALAEPTALQWWNPSRDRTPPAAPTGLTAASVGADQIDLTWKANGESDLSYYNVYRSKSSGGPYTKAGSVNKTASPKYSDTNLQAATTYYYVVTAVDKSGNQSTYSAQASARTQGSSGSPIGPRPAPIGVSTGHPRITAGTIGCRVKDASGKVYALSNNHVYAWENKASIGDDVLQPGAYDGGQDPRDAIGTLAAFQQISFSRRASNTIDAAIALSSTANLGNGTPAGSGSYGIPSITTVPATVNLAVKKHGRTTGLTLGTVYAINATVNVTYDSGTARFVNQIVITPGTFSAGGDSGSLIVTQDGNHPVGLLFAGSSSYTIANPIAPVLTRFNVTIDGQ